MFKDSFVYLVVRFVNGVLSLGAIYALTRTLTAEEYGLYALGAAAIGIAASVFFQWIAVSVSRFYAAHRDDPEALLGEAYRLLLCVASALMLVLTVLLVWTPSARLAPLLTLGVGIGAVGMGLFSLALQVANARGQVRRYGLLTGLRGALALVFSVLMVQLGLAGTGAVLGVALAAIVTVLCLGGRLQCGTRHGDASLRRQMVVYGLPLTLTYLTIMVLDMSGRFMIGWWFGAASVAAYAASYDLTQQTVGALLNVLFLSSYSRITMAWESGGTLAARAAMLPLSRAMVTGMPLIVGGFIGLAPEISRLVLGAAIQKEAAGLIPWIALAIGFGCFRSYFLDIAFQLAKTTRVQLGVTTVMAGSNFSLNLVLIPMFGARGAAMSTTAAYLLGTTVSWFLGRRLGVYPTSSGDLLGMVLALGAMALGCALPPVASGHALLDLLLRAVMGGVAFSAVVIAIDLAGARSLLMQRVRVLRRSAL
ncbi:lipopolysaccharide biosynthesis protein [Variovorax sp. JS1663]|uniref:lipopolysaccharide biosynthesis protein n=1 Tax=Variovorax sp. JS1663 TaxID=1851577 RepID=UPI000B342BC7|nr:lipopolysaccharide biosynthesis protein [Variovorax sp. JS1663]OUL99435.1 hypothetical protein A8M77_26550 [Variovorax sp. JS1663]